MQADRYEVHGISKSYGATRALQDVSVAFVGGEIHCLLGENGAGKSTLGKVVAGLASPDAGSCVWRGQPVAFRHAGEARAAGVAMVHQELSLAPDLCVVDNLWLGSERSRRMFSRLRRRDEREQAARMLAVLGIEADATRRAGDLPVATQQLVEAGKALLGRPRLVVFDEPTAMLGAGEKARLFALMQDLRDEGVAVVLVTHHIEDVLKVGDRVSVMRNGRLVDSFPLEADTTEDDVLFRLTGRRRDATPRAVPLPHAGAPCLEVTGLRDRAGRPRTLTVRPGEIVALYGVIGCGADALLRTLAGQPDASMPGVSMRLDGVDYAPRSAAAALKAGVAWLPAGRAANGILPGRSIAENAALSQHALRGLAARVVRDAEGEPLRERLAAFQVRYHRLEDPITSLSGGNQQKVLMARVIGAARRVLLLEEPTAGVDVEAKAQLHEHVRRAAESGLAVVLVSSDLPEVLSLAHRVCTLYCGQWVAERHAPGAGDVDAILGEVLGQRDSAPTLH